MHSVSPIEALRSRVHAIDLIDAASSETTVLPSTSVVLGIQLRGRVHAESGPLAVAGVTGLMPAARRYRYVDGTRSLLVRFTPLGAACLPVPVAELTGRSVALSDIFPAATVRTLHERVVEAPDAQSAMRELERFVLALPSARDPMVARALQRIEPLLVTRAPLVRSLAAELGVSERTLERRFVRQVGLSPKQFAALLRFERALRSRGHASLSALGRAAGYYDQAHFTREFRRFAGQPPGRFFAVP